MKKCLENVREKAPLVHNITNHVTVNDVANIILAAGASPIMADLAEDAEEITAICGSLNINIGTLNRSSVEAMFAAGKRAKELSHPLLLDPVGVGASTVRTETALKIMAELEPDVIRGNMSEIKTLFFGSGSTRGVDADPGDSVSEDNLDEAVRFAKAFAEKQNCIAAVTGAIDLVADKSTCYVIRNGRAEMSRITGTGCQLSGLMAAFIAANRGNMLLSAAAAVCAMGLAGEIGVKNMLPGEGNSTLRNRIIDAVYNMDGEILERGARYEIR